MNQDLQNQMVQLLAQVQNATEFAAANLPEIAADYLLLGRVIETCTMLLGVVLMALGVVCSYKILQAIRDQDADEGVCVLWSIGTILGAIFGVVVVAAAFPSFLAVWLAPKVYLLETLARLIK